MNTGPTFVTRTEAGTPDLRPLILLHGMGGDEHALIDFARAVAPNRTLIALRGRQVWKDGYTFFLRRADDQLDLADMALQLPPLIDWLEARVAQIGKPILLGYSLGAITIAAILAQRHDLAAGAVLLRPMPPGPFAPQGLDGLPVLMIGGARDERRDPADFPTLKRQLTDAGAEVSAHLLDTGHKLLTPGGDVTLTSAWLAARD